jgi:hypothetical protein
MMVGVKHASAFGGIISGTARCANTGRPLTRLLDYTERGLAMQATRTPKNYRSVTANGHPLAGKSRVMLLHRKLLFDRIGPGSHPCHWCGEPVEWRVGRPTIGSLVVDHVDHDKLNNAPENLVPSCNPCNGHRQRGDAWEPWVPGTPIGRPDRLHARCRKGHLLTPGNVYIRPDTKRRLCLACAQERRKDADASKSPEARAADLERHRRSVPCPVCGEPKSAGSLRRHIREMHERTPLKERQRQERLAAVLDGIRMVERSGRKLTARTLRSEVPKFGSMESKYTCRTLIDMALDDSRGATGCADMAERAGIPVRRFERKTESPS